MQISIQLHLQCRMHLCQMCTLYPLSSHLQPELQSKSDDLDRGRSGSPLLPRNWLCLSSALFFGYEKSRRKPRSQITDDSRRYKGHDIGTGNNECDHRFLLFDYSNVPSLTTEASLGTQNQGSPRFCGWNDVSYPPLYSFTSWYLSNANLD
jgi:hypothetical protein